MDRFPEGVRLRQGSNALPSKRSPDERGDIRDPTLPVQSRMSMRSGGLLLPRMSGLVKAAVLTTFSTN
jgi:hypothetical protein